MNKFGQSERVPTQAASPSDPRVAPSVIRSDIAFERHYSVHDLVALWGLSEKTIRRMFTDEPGVLEWGHEEERYKRTLQNSAHSRKCRCPSSSPDAQGQLASVL